MDWKDIKIMITSVDVIMGEERIVFTKISFEAKLNDYLDRNCISYLINIVLNFTFLVVTVSVRVVTSILSCIFC